MTDARDQSTPGSVILRHKRYKPSIRATEQVSWAAPEHGSTPAGELASAAGIGLARFTAKDTRGARAFKAHDEHELTMRWHCAFHMRDVARSAACSIVCSISAFLRADPIGRTPGQPSARLTLVCAFRARGDAAV